MGANYRSRVADETNHDNENMECINKDMVVFASASAQPTMHSTIKTSGLDVWAQFVSAVKVKGKERGQRTVGLSLGQEKNYLHLRQSQMLLRHRCQGLP